MDPVIGLLNQWGPTGVISVILWLMLKKSEDREKLKDTRIQLLENLIMESYSERIEAADRVAEAMHSAGNAVNTLTSKIDALLTKRIR